MLTTYNISFSKEAMIDIQEIYAYIKYNLKEPNTADKVIERIKKQIYQLSTMPNKHSIIDDELIKRLEVRKISIKNYIIFYRVKENKKEIQIVRIMNNRQNWKMIL